MTPTTLSWASTTGRPLMRCWWRRWATTAHITPGLPPLDPATELVLYRIAQEGLTNTARHARATRVEVHLRALPDARVALLVRDNGRGIGAAPEGAGISGMRERALLIGADLSIGQGPQGGTEIRLHVTGSTADHRLQETVR
jgi:two-component system sensor histidine kinase UhpB